MDDLISRQAVLEAISTTLKITGKENAETVYGYIKKLCDDIKALPSAQKKGHWSLQHGRMRTDYIHSGYMPHKNYCSCCEKDSPYDKRWKFCPNCGADMRGEADGENS